MNRFPTATSTVSALLAKHLFRLSALTPVHLQNTATAVVARHLQNTATAVVARHLQNTATAVVTRHLRNMATAVVACHPSLSTYSEDHLLGSLTDPFTQATNRPTGPRCPVHIPSPLSYSIPVHSSLQDMRYGHEQTAKTCLSILTSSMAPTNHRLRHPPYLPLPLCLPLLIFSIARALPPLLYLPYSTFCDTVSSSLVVGPSRLCLFTSMLMIVYITTLIWIPLNK